MSRESMAAAAQRRAADPEVQAQHLAYEAERVRRQAEKMAARANPEVAKALAAYRSARAAYTLAADREDAAFVRWFNKVQAGQPTNGAAASRLANETNYRSTDLASAQSALYRLDIDPHAIDRADGVEETPLGGSEYGA